MSGKKEASETSAQRMTTSALNIAAMDIQLPKAGQGQPPPIQDGQLSKEVQHLQLLLLMDGQAQGHLKAPGDYHEW